MSAAEYAKETRITIIHTLEQTSSCALELHSVLRVSLSSVRQRKLGIMAPTLPQRFGFGGYIKRPMEPEMRPALRPHDVRAPFKVAFIAMVY
jgi:hypothetical protein